MKTYQQEEYKMILNFREEIHKATFCIVFKWDSAWLRFPHYIFVYQVEAPCSYGFTDLIMTALVSHRVFTTKSLSLWSWIICSVLPQLRGITVVFLGPAESSGDQMKKSHLASPSKVSQS